MRQGSLVIPIFAYHKRHYLLRFAFRKNYYYRSGQRDEWLKFFDEVDVLQRPQAVPIPEEIWIPLSPQDVQAYFKNIALPKAADGEHRGKLIARKNCPCNLPFNFQI